MDGWMYVCIYIYVLWEVTTNSSKMKKHVYTVYIRVCMYICIYIYMYYTDTYYIIYKPEETPKKTNKKNALLE